MARKLRLLAIIAATFTLGGCPESGLDIVDGSREEIHFDLYVQVRYPEGYLDTTRDQSCVVTSWRKDAGTGEIEADTLIEDRCVLYAMAGWHFKVTRRYLLGDHERIVFHVVSTGATTQGTATVSYQKSQVWFDAPLSITDTINVTLHDITRPP